MRPWGVMTLAVLLVALAPAMGFAAEVAEATMCLGVEDRQPVDPGVSFPADIDKVWCWSKIKDGEGTKIRHIYYYNDEEMATIELAVRSPLFRTYSSKQILPNWTGKWRADIVDEAGTVLKSLAFTIGELELPQPEGPAEEPEASQ